MHGSGPVRGSLNSSVLMKLPGLAGGSLIGTLCWRKSSILAPLLCSLPILTHNLNLFNINFRMMNLNNLTRVH